MNAEKFDEAEAARRLGISKATLSRARLAGDVFPMRHGKRVIRYTEAILDEYRNRVAPSLDEIVAQAEASRVPLLSGPGVYFLWRGDEIIYICMSRTFHTRLASHLWCKQFDTYSFVPVPEQHVLQVEAALIRKFRPELNYKHAGRESPE